MFALLPGQTLRRAAELTGWPRGTEPLGASVFAHNELVIDGTCAEAWTHLVRAADWPRWYINARGVRLPAGQTELTAGTEFSWETFGARINSMVVRFEPPYELGWTYWGRSAYGYHGWKLEPDGQRTRVVTEETQRGFLPERIGFLMSPALRIAHQHWLRVLGSRSG